MQLYGESEARYLDKVHPTWGDTSNFRLKERNSKPHFDKSKNREKIGRFVTNIWQKAIGAARRDETCAKFRTTRTIERNPILFAKRERCWLLIK